MDQLTNVDRVPEDIARAVLDPRAYGEWHDLHQKLATLRREHPFARADLEGYDPFWIAAKFADIQEVALRSEVFLSGLGAMQSRKEFEMNAASRGMFRSQGELFPPDVSAAVSADPEFLECTGAAQANYIVTGNKRDFPDVSYGVTRVVSAGELVDQITFEI